MQNGINNIMSTLPTSFTASRLGYKKYLLAGGSLDYSAFCVYERRSFKEIAAEKINRFHAAMIYHYDQAMYYKSIGDEESYEVNMIACDIRSKHLSEAHKEYDAIK